MSGEAPPGMRVLVCGGRDYADRDALFAAMDRLDRRRPVSVVIHGAAPGADALAAEWARERGCVIVAYPADWARGRAAGPLRNQRMIDDGRPDGVVAFPGRRGTADMVRRALAAGLKVWRPADGR